jgi:hypothetical protein
MAYNYAIVEAALAKVHKIGEGSMGAFRARIQHLQKLGIVPARPGKGKRVAYTQEDILLWAFCLELSEIGISPSAIKDIVAKYWVHYGIRDCFHQNPEKDDIDRYLLLDPNLLNENRNKSFFKVSISSDLLKNLHIFKFRTIVVNVSNVRRQLLNAVEESHKVRAVAGPRAQKSSEPTPTASTRRRKS